jgi:hypothetical protein
MNFTVWRLNQGRQKGQVWVLPNCKPGLRMKNGQTVGCLPTKAEPILVGATYIEAFYFASGLLRGETGEPMSPYVKFGQAPHWKQAITESP